jgi:hypothetical protein
MPNIVNGVKQIKSWFFQVTAAGFKRGSRFLNNDKPTEQTFRNLVESVTFKAEPLDQALKDDVSNNLGDKAGLVVIASDGQVTNRTQVSGRTIVVQPHNLPTVDDNGSETFSYSGTPAPPTSYTGELITVTETPQTYYNKYLVRLTQGFKDFLETAFTGIQSSIYGLAQTVNQNTADITTLDTRVDGHDASIAGILNTLDNLVVPGADTVISDNADYKLVRNINGNEFIIRFTIKQTCSLSNIVLLPSNLAYCMTIDDARYIAYGAVEGTSYRYDGLSITFNKLKSNASYVIGGDAFAFNLRLYDNVGDFNYQIPFIKNTGFVLTNGIFNQAFPGSLLEFTFKGSLVGKL